MYWEDFKPGEAVTTGTRQVTIQDLEDFTALSWLDNPLFTSDEGARAAGHAQRLVPAPLQLSIAMGLCQRAGLFDRVVAVLGFENLRFRRPVHPGHSLRVRARVEGVKPVSNPGRGLVTLDYVMTNQDGDEVMAGRALYMMRRRPADG